MVAFLPILVVIVRAVVKNGTQVEHRFTVLEADMKNLNLKVEMNDKHLIVLSDKADTNATAMVALGFKIDALLERMKSLVEVKAIHVTENKPEAN